MKGHVIAPRLANMFDFPGLFEGDFALLGNHQKKSQILAERPAQKLGSLFFLGFSVLFVLSRRRHKHSRDAKQE